MRLDERSSTSSTAISYLALLKRLQPLSNAVAIPELILDPARLLSTFIPDISNTSQVRLETVVLPLVPVMAMILAGFPMYFKKSGQSFKASLPGKSVPLWPVIFSKGFEILAAHKATKNRRKCMRVILLWDIDYMSSIIPSFLTYCKNRLWKIQHNRAIMNAKLVRRLLHVCYRTNRSFLHHP